MAMQVIFQHHNGVSGTGFQFAQRGFQRAAANHTQTDAVHRTGNHGHANVSTAAFQSFGHVGCGLNDLCATGVGTGNNQRFLRTGQGLNNHVNLVLQVAIQLNGR